MKSNTAVITAPGELEFEIRDTGKLGSDEVLVKTRTFGLCGSDLHLFAGSYKGPHQYPVVPGHEWAGEVVALGDDVTGFKTGDKVTGEAAMWCGECKFCAYDKNICLEIEKRGLTVDGYASQYVIAKQRHLYKVPDEMDFELACMTEPFAVADHAIIKGMGEGPAEHNKSKVLVMGAGPIGMAVAMLLTRQYGFNNVYISDLVQYRIDVAKELGIKEYKLQIKDTNAAISYKQMYDIDGFDYIFESTGVNAVLNSAFLEVNPLGSIIMLAPIRKIELGGGLVVLKSVKLIGSIGGGGDFERVIKAFSKHMDYYKKVITHRFAFAQLGQALKVQKEEQERLKIIINDMAGE